MDTMQIITLSAISLEALIIIVLAFKVFSISRHIKSLFGDKSSESIEKILESYVLKVKDFHTDIEEIKDFSHTLYEMAEKSVQKVGFVRFNPFGDVGGDQSFSVAFLDFKNNGVVVTSLFGREGTRVYSKPIKDGASPNHLAEEEKKAIEEAIKNYKKGA
ncbi:DUF4446 family protein [bacterium]|nr:DUF4446 family protein [bacterium]